MQAFNGKLSLKAKIVKTDQQGKNHGGEKEMVSAYSVLAKVKGQLQEVVTCRCYMGRSRNSSTVYASIWVSGNNVWTAGHGNAGGWGYHKESAAIEAAIRAAGIELYGSPYQGSRTESADYKKRAYIGGCGDGAAREALLAIARALGCRGALYFVSH